MAEETETNQEVFTIKALIADIPVRRKALARIFGRFRKPAFEAECLFEAESLEEEPEAELLAQTIQVLDATRLAAYNSLSTRYPAVSLDEIRVNCFRFCFNVDRKGVLGELVPVDGAHVNHDEEALDLKTRWMLGEEVGAVLCFVKRRAYSIDHRRLALQRTHVASHAVRSHPDLKWVTNLPILRRASSLPVGIVSVDGLKTEIDLNHLVSFLHPALIGHAATIGGIWQNLRSSRVFIAKRKV